MYSYRRGSRKFGPRLKKSVTPICGGMKERNGEDEGEGTGVVR